MKSNGNHSNLALYRTELRRLKLSSAWRGELSITLTSALWHAHKQHTNNTHTHTHTHKQHTHTHTHTFACSFIRHMTSQARDHDIFLFIWGVQWMDLNAETVQVKRWKNVFLRMLKHTLQLKKKKKREKIRKKKKPWKPRISFLSFFCFFGVFSCFESQQKDTLFILCAILEKKPGEEILCGNVRTRDELSWTMM